MIKKEELIKELKDKNVYTDLVKKALRQAEISHAGQKRDNGSCNLENHIYSITYSILKRYKNHKMLEDLVVLALLHDTMEDDEDFDEGVCLKSFGKEICKNVKKLTKDEMSFKKYSNSNKYFYELKKFFCNKDYIENVNGSNEICKIVKLEDRIDTLRGIEEIGNSVTDLRYVMEAETLFVEMAKKTKSFDYLPVLKKETKRLSSYLPKMAT